MDTAEILLKKKSLEAALAQSTEALATSKFGKNAPQPFIHAVKQFLDTTPPDQQDAAKHYIESVYRAINTLQIKTLIGEDTRSAKHALSEALWAVNRDRNLAGMQTAKLFADQVEAVTLKAKEAIMGTDKAR